MPEWFLKTVAFISSLAAAGYAALLVISWSVTPVMVSTACILGMFLCSFSCWFFVSRYRESVRKPFDISLGGFFLALVGLLIIILTINCGAPYPERGDEWRRIKAEAAECANACKITDGRRDKHRPYAAEDLKCRCDNRWTFKRYYIKKVE